MKGVGAAESSEICLADVTIHICHEDNGIPSGLPRSEGGREVPEEGIMGTGGVTQGFQVVLLLGVDCLKAGFLGFIRVVATNNANAVACVALEAEPRPAAQTRGVHTRSSNVGCDWTRAKEECAAKLPLAEVVMDVMAGNSA